ncbi:TetR family transcriptional regulator [Pseudonocardia sp. WMMC193]|uniref:TetR family transcriptional regulator n=1 Tax=Pseudonocardia sp. WMMC193 TaxID=2911965 RepID=UPI001F3B82E3|nr:TetR family transcriptional regulator [Pseudonocardia sp. WMMC193]MCF7553177.1 TetR/AcrR family transcriptional regulator [Pseudonocardia sp. WMMC193]
MARWRPGTRERLQEAALGLFATRGFEQTTATEIAEAAGVTERTFYRHFSDKREVLFDGQEVLLEAFLGGMRRCPADAPPVDLVAGALQGVASFFSDERRPWSRARQAVIDANPALQERELSKLATIGGLLTAALRDRGVPDPAATLAAGTAVMVFGATFGRWLDPAESRPFDQIAHALLDELGALVTRPAPLARP